MIPSSFSTPLNVFATLAKSDPLNPNSGVICFPNNYQYGEERQLNEGFLRVTAMANHDKWCALNGDDYLQRSPTGMTNYKSHSGLLPKPKKNLNFEITV